MSLPYAGAGVGVSRELAMTHRSTYLNNSALFERQGTCSTSQQEVMRPGVYVEQHMLLVCGRRVGSGSAVHGDLGFGRLLRVDGVHRLLLEHWPVTCGVVWRQQTNKTGGKYTRAGVRTRGTGRAGQEMSGHQSNAAFVCLSVWHFWVDSNQNQLYSRERKELDAVRFLL